jgi:uncharacterized protein YqeY
VSTTSARQRDASARKPSVASAEASASPSALKERLDRDVVTAVKARDDLRRDTLRFVLAAVRTEQDARRTAAIDELVKKGVDETGRAAWLAEHTPDKLTDEMVMDVLKRQIKMRRDSIDAFEKGGRTELAAKEKAQLDVIASYLPAQLDEAAVEAAVRKAIIETGAAGPKDMGKVMTAVRAVLGDRAEGRVVSAVAQRVLKERAGA